jgi:integrase/recombinase XerD
MGLTFEVAASHFLDHCRIARTLSGHTLRAYRSDLSHAAYHLGPDVAVETIDRDHLRRYIGAMLHEEMLKQSSVKRRLATLKQLFSWLEREEVLVQTPFHRLDVTIRIPHRLPRALTVDEARALLSQAEHEARIRQTHTSVSTYFAVVALIVSGLRVGELTSVAYDDVTLADGSILVRGKGNRERRVYLSGQLARRVLDQYLFFRGQTPRCSESLLVDSEGAPLTPQHFRRRLATLCKRAQIKRHITPHMLRHTAATQLIEAGVDIRFVQKLLGHASIATTQIYTQVSDVSLRNTLEKANTFERLVLGSADN